MKLNKIETPHLMTKIVNAPIPDYVIQQRDAGRGQKLDYISGSTVIDMLNTTFGMLGWSAEYPQFWVTESVPFFNKYSKSKEKTTHNGVEGAWEEQGPVAWAKCRLTVLVEKEDGTLHQVVKEAFGSKSIIGKQSEQEHIYKSAQTDALKKAASLLGIGAELYREEEEQTYFEQISKPIIWTEEKQKNSEDWTILQGIAEENGWALDDIDYYVNELTDGEYTDIYTLPEAWLPNLIDYLRDGSEDEEEEDEE